MSVDVRTPLLAGRRNTGPDFYNSTIQFSENHYGEANQSKAHRGSPPITSTLDADLLLDIGCNEETSIQRRNSFRKASLASINEAVEEDSKGDGENDGCRTTEDKDVEVDVASRRELKLYRRRWYILMVYSLYSAYQNGFWNTYDPIAAVSEQAFGWDNATIALLNNWGNVAYVVATLFFSWMMQVKGLRASMLLSTGMIAVGAGLRCVSTSPPLVTWMAHIAQILNGLAGPVATAGMPVVSAVWFPAGQRTTATGISNFISFVGLAVSFVMGPYLVPEENATAHHSGFHGLGLMMNSSNSTIIAEEKENIIRYMYIAAGVAVLCFLLVLVYFPDKPPQSPSMSSTLSRESFVKSFAYLFRMVQFWQITFVFGITQGVVSVWSSVLEVNLKPYGISQNESGWIGFYSTMGGCLAGLIMAKFSDSCIHYMKWITMVLYVLGLGCFLWFTLILLGVLPASTAALYTTVILGTTAVTATLPLLYEMGCECAFPVAEGTANGVLTLVNNLAGGIFMFFLMVPSFGTMWMNWTLIASIAVSIPVLVVMRDEYRRTSLDEHSPLPAPGQAEL